MDFQAIRRQFPFTVGQAFYCDHCEDVACEPAKAKNPLGSSLDRVDVWECPECNAQFLREEP